MATLPLVLVQGADSVCGVIKPIIKNKEGLSTRTIYCATSSFTSFSKFDSNNIRMGKIILPASPTGCNLVILPEATVITISKIIAYMK